MLVTAPMTTSLTALARADAVGIHRSGPLCPRFPLLCCDANPHTRATTTLQLVSVVADTVRLNVGGTKFTTTLSTLRAAPGSKLACGVEEWVDADGVVPGSQHLFIDSDPETFAWGCWASCAAAAIWWAHHLTACSKRCVRTPSSLASTSLLQHWTRRSLRRRPSRATSTHCTT